MHTRFGPGQETAEEEARRRGLLVWDVVARRTWKPTGLTQGDLDAGADPGNAELVTKGLCLDGVRRRGASTLGIKDNEYEDERPVRGRAAREYRSHAMRVGLLGRDGRHLQYQTKELARGMSCPTVGAQRRLKRVARFLRNHPRHVQSFKMQEAPGKFDIFTGSDWAGDAVERKSTSSTYLFH